MKTFRLQTIIAVAACFCALLLIGGIFLKNNVTGKSVRVSDFGAIGDGVTDDRQAVEKAFEALLTGDAGFMGKRTLFFDQKSYLIGDKNDSWYVFSIPSTSRLTIAGNGAVLLLSSGNLAFHFDRCDFLTVKDLTFDYWDLPYTQGTIIHVDRQTASIDVEIHEGYPVPPTDSFLSSNGQHTSGGGGRHGLVFEKDEYLRNMDMTIDHVKARSITHIRDNVYRFILEDDYAGQIARIQCGNRFTYGFNGMNIPAEDLRRKKGMNFGLMYFNICRHLLLDNVSIYTSMNNGFRTCESSGIIQNTRILVKPGTNRLISVLSDGFHIKNTRDKLIIEDCLVESTGDDGINVSTMEEYVVEILDPLQLKLRTTDVQHYFYPIRKGDHLQFFDATKTFMLGSAEVTAVETDPANRLNLVTLNKPVENITVGNLDNGTHAYNLNQVSTGIIIRNNTVKPLLRNALLVRMHGGLIENNRIQSRGGVVGISLSSDKMFRVGPYPSDVRVTGNILEGLSGRGILVSSGFPGVEDKPSRNIILDENTIHMRQGPGITLMDVQAVTLTKNIIETPSVHPISIVRSHDVVIDGVSQ